MDVIGHNACAVVPDLAVTGVLLWSFTNATDPQHAVRERPRSIRRASEQASGSGVDPHAQVKQARWNARAPGFIAIHKLFDKVSSEVENYSDLIAERAGGSGGTAYGTVQVAAERSFLVPYPFGIADEQGHVFAISGTLAAFGQSAREAIGQATTFWG